MSIKRLSGAIAMALMVTAATFHTAYALTPPPPGTPPATRTPPQIYTGIAAIDGKAAPPGTVVTAAGTVPLFGAEGRVDANGTYSLEMPTHHHSLGYLRGMTLSFTVAGLPAAETSVVGLEPVVLNLTVITPLTDGEPTVAPISTYTPQTETPAPAATVQSQAVPPTDTPVQAATVPSQTVSPTDNTTQAAIVQNQTVLPTDTPVQGGLPPGVRVSLVAEPSEMSVGDLATMSLIVSHPEDYTVVIPRLEREWGPFEVQAQTSVQTVSLNDGIRTVAKQFRVTLFTPGTFETPDLPFSIRGPEGSVARVSPAPIQLTVNSVLASPDEELKDLRPPADLSTPFWERTIVLVLIAIAALVVACGTAFFFYRRTRRMSGPPVAAPDTRAPWEVATQELDRIARLDLPGGGDMKEHYTLVAAALRVYLGATSLRASNGANADEMTTAEVASAVWQSALDHGNATLVIELLQEVDLVKFANHEPTSARANEAVVQVRNFVEATRPAASVTRDSAPTVRGAAP